jgi:phosphopantetheine adenylyltransferase
MDYYQKVDQINQRLANEKELDNYIENVLEGTFDSMDSGHSYLKVGKGEIKMEFRLTEDSTVKSLKEDIKNRLNEKIKFLQKILCQI